MHCAQRLEISPTFSKLKGVTLQASTFSFQLFYGHTSKVVFDAHNLTPQRIENQTKAIERMPTKTAIGTRPALKYLMQTSQEHRSSLFQAPWRIGHTRSYRYALRTLGRSQVLHSELLRQSGSTSFQSCRTFLSLLSRESEQWNSINLGTHLFGDLDIWASQDVVARVLIFAGSADI